ncbi:MAG TPA: YdbL family protein [Allosphingosinicella sp.]
MKWVLGLGIAIAVAGGGAGMAQAMFQDASAQLRSTGQVGERYDGYLGVVGDASASLRAEVDAINIKRRAFYTDLAAKRGAKIEEVGATTACQIFATKIQPGQYYMLTDGVWRQRDGNTPVPRPTYCG